MLRLQRYKLTVEYRKGSTLVLADTLSRATLPVTNDSAPSEFDVFRVEVEETMKQPNLGLTSPTTKALQAATSSDPDMIALCKLIRTDWPQSKREVPEVAMPYWPVTDELSLADGIVYRGL